MRGTAGGSLTLSRFAFFFQDYTLQDKYLCRCQVMVLVACTPLPPHVFCMRDYQGIHDEFTAFLTCPMRGTAVGSLMLSRCVRQDSPVVLAVVSTYSSRACTFCPTWYLQVGTVVAVHMRTVQWGSAVGQHIRVQQYTPVH
jgi:hypothetical protein